MYGHGKTLIKTPDIMKEWIVFRCFIEYNEVFKREDASFATEKEADDYAESAYLSDGCIGIWYEVCES